MVRVGGNDDQTRLKEENALMRRELNGLRSPSNLTGENFPALTYQGSEAPSFD